MIKKLFCALLAAAMLICTAGCSDSGNKQSAENKTQKSEQIVESYKMTDYKEIFFDDVLPNYLEPTSAWDAMGQDDNGMVYFGWTCNNSRYDREDFAVLSYNPKNSKVKFIDTFMNASERADNLESGEAIPKGHTKFVCVDGKIYLGSQGFHDFKEEIDTLGDYRGAHIYCYDPKTNELTDLAASVPGGVVTENEGIVSLNVMEDRNLLVGLTHPLSNLVFFNYKTGKVEREVEGIPWSLGNPLSREIIVEGDKVYLYRGVEDAANRSQSFPVYCYDYAKDKLIKTKYNCFGGFWNGQATTKDGKTTYISGCCGELYKLDRESGKITYLNSMNPQGEGKMDAVYSLNFSPDESKIFYIPTMYQPSGVYAYDIASNTVNQIGTLPMGCYTGNGVAYGNKYFYASFSTTTQNWVGDCRMLEITVEK